jgi:hypothetical protein
MPFLVTATNLGSLSASDVLRDQIHGLIVLTRLLSTTTTSLSNCAVDPDQLPFLTHLTPVLGKAQQQPTLSNLVQELINCKFGAVLPLHASFLSTSRLLHSYPIPTLAVPPDDFYLF